MDFEKINIWTNTLYALIQSLHIAKSIKFGNQEYVDENIRDAADWIQPECSYSSVLLEHQGKGKKIKLRRDPNKHFDEITNQIIKMLIQDLVVILDLMMDEALKERNVSAGNYPKSKIEKLSTYLKPKYEWAAQGCLELIAVRNALTHNGGDWNEQSIAYVEPFVHPLPKDGDKLIIGFPMLFSYRKAIRTFLNEVKIA